MPRTVRTAPARKAAERTTAARPADPRQAGRTREDRRTREDPCQDRDWNE